MSSATPLQPGNSEQPDDSESRLEAAAVSDAETSSATALVTRCQEIMAHAWMVRTFVKHSPEVEDFPELMQAARTIFDVSLSLESRVSDPAAYLKQLNKKLRKLRESAAQFSQDVPAASDHTNFKMAVQSFQICVRELEQIAATARVIQPPPPGKLATRLPQTASTRGNPPATKMSSASAMETVEIVATVDTADDADELPAKTTICLSSSPSRNDSAGEDHHE